MNKENLKQIEKRLEPYSWHLIYHFSFREECGTPK